MIYVSAVYANAEHTLVIGTDALGNTETVPADFTLFRQPEHGPVGFLANGGVIGDYVAPETPSAAPALYLWGVGQFGISPGEITGIETSVKFLAGLYLDVGLYYLYFSETLPDTSYLAKAYDAATVVRVSEKGTDYIAVSATDAGGTPVDPSEISVEIIRVS